MNCDKNQVKSKIIQNKILFDTKSTNIINLIISIVFGNCEGLFDQFIDYSDDGQIMTFTFGSKSII
ncbi:hypothetical protein GCM10011506_44230 [Marivirga lumbricoides]|uniref:Uncharacterized protein n=1 Tax=Marivirga lumbricoides TaxID=1046115 RepID=A0ABQ1M7B8_9BACT|nr:hypothetical protein GCM10011506_19990 [Marivirga lumbricoides]GGC53763.1 hypothetical protein GCM10011506_44230 [Marivirga lumbricoides]